MECNTDTDGKPSNRLGNGLLGKMHQKGAGINGGLSVAFDCGRALGL